MSSFVIILFIHYGRKHRYKLKTWSYKLKLARKGKMGKMLFNYDVYMCYVYEDDRTMEEIRLFLEDKSSLKCCIPHRNLGACDTDHVTALEQNLEKSASTVVLWSRAALA